SEARRRGRFAAVREVEPNGFDLFGGVAVEHFGDGALAVGPAGGHAGTRAVLLRIDQVGVVPIVLEALDHEAHVHALDSLALVAKLDHDMLRGTKRVARRPGGRLGTEAAALGLTLGG